MYAGKLRLTEDNENDIWFKASKKNNKYRNKRPNDAKNEVLQYFEKKLVKPQCSNNYQSWKSWKITLKFYLAPHHLPDHLCLHSIIFHSLLLLARPFSYGYEASDRPPRPNPKIGPLANPDSIARLRVALSSDLSLHPVDGNRNSPGLADQVNWSPRLNLDRWIWLLNHLCWL